MTKKKWFLPTVIVIAVLALAAAGIAFWMHHRQANSTVEVFPVSSVADSYWGDTTSLDCTVTEGSTQAVKLADALVEEVLVSEGDEVHTGDVLLRYDTTSFQLALQADEAKIAVAQTDLETAQSDLAKYKSLQPSENMPSFEPEDPDPIEVSPQSYISGSPVNGATYYCFKNTVVSAGFLTALAKASGYVVILEVYDEDCYTHVGTWTIRSSSLASYLENEDDDDEPDDPNEPDEPDDPGEPDEPGPTPVPEPTPDPDPVTPSTTVTTPSKLTDWALNNGITYEEDGSVTIDFSVPHYGTFRPCNEVEYEETEETYYTDYSENYMYSRAELAQMITEKEQEIETLKLDLEAAKLKLRQDSLVTDNGEVIAKVDGTVTGLKQVSEVVSGGTLFTVKGEENYAVIAYVSELSLETVSIGDTLSVYTYESGSSFTATITEISDEPSADNHGWGNENPNNSWYPVTASVDDPDVQLTIGESGSAELDSTDGGGGLFIPVMYVRSDSMGDYVFADEDGRLVRRSVKTGRNLYGSEVEILAGLSEEDSICFPYGTSVAEGARTTPVDYPSYY